MDATAQKRIAAALWGGTDWKTGEDWSNSRGNIAADFLVCKRGRNFRCSHWSVSCSSWASQYFSISTGTLSRIFSLLALGASINPQTMHDKSTEILCLLLFLFYGNCSTSLLHSSWWFQISSYPINFFTFLSIGSGSLAAHESFSPTFCQTFQNAFRGLVWQGKTLPLIRPLSPLRHYI